MSTRDLDFIKWHDKYAVLEDMDSKEFKKAVSEEIALYNTEFDSVPKEQVKKWEDAYSKIQPIKEPYYRFEWLNHSIHVYTQNRMYKTIVINTKGKQQQIIEGVCSFGQTASHLWYIKDSTDGKEQWELNILDTLCKIIKQIPNVAENAESTLSDIYYVNAKDTFWFYKASKISNALHITDIYEETDAKYVLIIIKPARDPKSEIFILRKSALFQDLGLVSTHNSIKWLDKGFGIKLPLDTKSIAYDSYFTINGDKIAYPNNQFLSDAFKRNDIYYFILKSNVYNTLYKYENNVWVQIQSPIVADITQLSQTTDILVGYPNKPDNVVRIEDRLKIIHHISGPTYNLEHENDPVPWFAVIPNSKPKGIVICGYGSYGMCMRKTQQNIWIPWLQQGYVIASICVRGGSENGQAWWDASRTAKRRWVGVDDFIDGMKYIQNKFGFDASNTIIYGRSAGGFLVTAVANKIPGNIGVVYAAKPYTDVLRTVTNIKLSQVIQEMDEFGYVANDPSAFLEVAKISPYENVPENPRKNPAVLLTGGIKDPEVMVYMPLKFVKRLHDVGWKKTVIRITDEGHFTIDNKSEAHDAALCEFFLNRLNV
jgi:hypothetical protein